MYSGNVIAYGDSYGGASQAILLGNGKKRVTATGLAILTDTLRTSIPVKIYPARNKELAPDYPLADIILPIGAQVVAASFRLPGARIPGFPYEWGKQLPTGCTIVGTSTDVLKIAIGANNNFTAANTASLASASNAYTIGGTGFITRNLAVADNASGILNTVASPAKTITLAVDNAANSAAGTGIRLSLAGATAAIAVKVVYEINDDPVLFEEVMLGGTTKSFYIRG
jgi:hypothetical protein